MAESIPAAFQLPEELEAFTVVVLRYLDDDCSAEEIAQVKELLCTSAAHAKLFVEMCRLHGDMHEAFAAKRAGLQAKAARVAAAVPAPVANVGRDLPELPAEPFLSEDLIKQAQDAASDTVVRELSGEDTAHPTPPTPEQ